MSDSWHGISLFELLDGIPPVQFVALCWSFWTNYFPDLYKRLVFLTWKTERFQIFLLSCQEYALTKSILVFKVLPFQKFIQFRGATQWFGWFVQFETSNWVWLQTKSLLGNHCWWLNISIFLADLCDYIAVHNWL